MDPISITDLRKFDHRCILSIGWNVPYSSLSDYFHHQYFQMADEYPDESTTDYHYCHLLVDFPPYKRNQETFIYSLKSPNQYLLDFLAENKLGHSYSGADCLYSFATPGNGLTMQLSNQRVWLGSPEVWYAPMPDTFIDPYVVYDFKSVPKNAWHILGAADSHHLDILTQEFPDHFCAV